MVSPDPSRLHALISLLSDDSPRVVAEARRVLRDLGPAALGGLEVAIDSADARLRGRARLMREEVRGGLLEKEMRRLADRIDTDENALEAGCILLARTRDFDLDVAAIPAALDAMADDLGSRLGSQRGSRPGAAREPAVVVDAMTRFLSRELGFHGAQRNYYDPENWFVDRVLARRIGIPISLSAICLFLARRLDLPLIGIGLPGHFIVRYGASEPVLYIDPFHGGRVFGERECQRFLQERSVGWDPSYLLPMSDGAMLLRMMRNLLQIYRSRGDAGRVALLQRMKGVLVREEVSGKELGAAEPER